MAFRNYASHALLCGLSVLTAGCFLSGCATQAVQTESADARILQTTIIQANTCTAAANKEASFSPLYAHVPLNNIDTATLAQMASDDYATSNDITLLSAYRAQVIPCRQIVINGLSAVSPGAADPYTKLFNGEDAAAVALAQHRITWGQFVSVVKEMNDLTRQAAREALASVDSELSQENAQEQEQRREEFQAFATYLQRQDAINAANRPVTTNCNSFGTQTTCISN